ncbi:MAG: ThuA domain-containing protein [Verrucomicrobiota bacterium]|jgi:type 1 glutamine amidotransferase|nr:ThuA domain-containing protein [Verrucomicrobiae bacterium]
MKLRTLLALTALVGLTSTLAAEQKPLLRVLVVAGGCCHDYATQKEVLKKGIEARVNAVVEVAYDPTKSTKPLFELFKSPDWGKNFDVVVHDECAADITDQAYVANIVNAHKNGLPAVNLHCAMHSYRWGNFKEPVKAGADNASWYEMLGLQSTGHGPQQPIAITFTDKSHPVTTGLADWTTINEELYNNVQVLGAKTLATGLQKVPEKKDKKGKVTPASEANAIVAWTNEFGPKKTRIFSTTIGHNNATVEDARYLDLVARAVLWSAGKLEADGKPSAGFGK